MNSVRRIWRNVSWADGDLRCSGAPAAETALHVAFYQLFPQCKAVLHSHSLSSTVFSRLIRADGYPISGYEMQKGIAGCSDADEALQLVILDNAPEVTQLAAQLRQRAGELHSAVLVRGPWPIRLGRYTGTGQAPSGKLGVFDRLRIGTG